MYRGADPIPELKRQLAAELLRLMGTTPPTQLIYEMRIDQPRISDLRRGRLERFSLERLIRLLRQMHHRVQLTVVEEKPRFGRRRGE